MLIALLAVEAIALALTVELVARDRLHRRTAAEQEREPKRSAARQK
ncbi:hypothetical protein HLK59_03605 [Streptomyces sp. S3(2020)]|nr:hypothetical protein [Streptomyces sp. S3(2020)]NNN29454.1 hypothetical protein [Streptomyces sp. S3(2020)]